MIEFKGLIDLMCNIIGLPFVYCSLQSCEVCYQDINLAEICLILSSISVMLHFRLFLLSLFIPI